MINKNISVWRGDQNPPTEYHLWLKEGKLFAKINADWEQISGEDIPLASNTVDGLMSAADKVKVDNYPEQFVLDLGILNSQLEGEIIAAKSEVAGNRNISFIRFKVQGHDKLKTILIMQWPNGINETAQIMCVDKAQWRRNVTGATGVEGAPTNAYPWERTAPHSIDYDGQRRIIQLKDYENQTVSQEVELPLASDTVDGLLAASDFTSLKDNTTKIQSIWKGNPALVSPSIFFSWNILNQNGTRVESSSSYNITYEKGYKANFTGGWRWVQTEGKKNPTRTDGSWGTVLLASNTDSAPLSIKNITTNTTISQNLYAPKLGLMVSGSNVTPASGEDKTTTSASITFKDRLYYGVVSSSTPTESDIKQLINELVSSRTKTISNITANQYYCYAYPQSLGALTKITQDGATPVLGAFTQKTLTITNAAGLSVALYVYVSNNPGAFTNNELKFE